MFQSPVDDPARLGSVLKRWLCDRAMPSAMKAEFPWLRLESLARAYEEGWPVEGEFLASWDSIKQFYTEWNFSFTKAVLALIADIRRASYDRALRAGQSLSNLIVSRSRRHGLRYDQPSIAFCFGEPGMVVYVNSDGEEKPTFPDIEFTPQVDALLRRLAAETID